jgi:hypothetical protein
MKNKKYLENILLILIIMIVMILVPFIRKVCIISDLSSKAENYSACSNAHIVKYSYNDNAYIKIEYWQLGEDKKIEKTSLYNEILSNTQIYAKKSNDNYIINTYANSNEGTIFSSDIQSQFVGLYVENMFKKENIFELLKASAFAKIENTVFDGKECYYILNFDRGNGTLSNGVYVDKETGLIINEISYQYEDENTYPATSYIYEFNTVNENDFVEPSV